MLRKLHSLTGVFPLGLFVVLHLFMNAKALQGRQAFEESLESFFGFAYLPLFEVLFILLPLLFHGIYGIKLGLSARPKLGQYPYSRNWAYTLQRLTGFVAFAFIAYHLYDFRVQVLLGSMSERDVFPELCAKLSSTAAGGVPLVAIVYLIGAAAVVYHLANGLYGFCFSWGITLSRRATRLASAAFGLLGIALFALAAGTIIYFATGSSVVLSRGLDGEALPPVTCEHVRDVAAARVPMAEN